MKILVYGAGVIGTLYAARLQEGGHMQPDSRKAAIALLSLRAASGLRISAVMVWRLKTSSGMVDRRRKSTRSSALALTINTISH